MEALKTRVPEAIELCDLAAKSSPGEPRYRYQLARAYQVNEPSKAIPILKQLMSERYPAAFDNYGWALVDSRSSRVPDYNGASVAFRGGVGLGDPDSMDSLASLILQGKVPARFPDEPTQLLKRAASMGHLGAQARLAKAQADLAHDQQQQFNEQRNREMIGNIIGGFIRAIPPR